MQDFRSNIQLNKSVNTEYPWPSYLPKIRKARCSEKFNIKERLQNVIKFYCLRAYSFFISKLFTGIFWFFKIVVTFLFNIFLSLLLKKKIIAMVLILSLIPVFLGCYDTFRIFQKVSEKDQNNSVQCSFKNESKIVPIPNCSYLCKNNILLMNNLKRELKATKKIINAFNFQMSKLNQTRSKLKRIQTEVFYLKKTVAETSPNIRRKLVRDMISLFEELKINNSEICNPKYLDKKQTINNTIGSNLVDYAMKSIGGTILSTKNTDLYFIKSTIHIMNFPLFNSYSLISPDVVITPGYLTPGKCWCFKNFPGILIIKLAYPVFIEKISIEHVDKLLVPHQSMLSTPKAFKIFGMINEYEIDLGGFEYNLDRSPLQNFEIFTQESFQVVKFLFTSNYGHSDYTCIYRIRVYGTQ